jgi:Outer membrane protein beta-barrel domain
MNKVVVLLFMTILAVSASGKDAKKKSNEDQAEKHFYIKAGVGYAFPNAGQSWFSGSSQTTMPPGSFGTTTTFKIKSASFTAGLSGPWGGGYMFSEHLGIELDVNIGIANTKYTYVDDQISSVGTKETMKATSYAKMPILAVPAVVIQSGGAKLNVYSRLGAVFPVKNKIIIETEKSSAYSNEQRTQELTTRFRVGFSGALGVSHNITERILVFGEVNMLSFAPYLKESNVTKYTVNGVDNLSSMSQQDKVTKYEFSASFTSSYSTNNPTVVQTFSVPYSNIGLAAGVSFSID